MIISGVFLENYSFITRYTQLLELITQIKLLYSLDWFFFIFYISMFSIFMLKFSLRSSSILITGVLFFVFLIFLLTSGLSLFSFSPQSPFSLPFLCPVWLLCFVVSGLDVEQCLGPASRGSCGIRTCRWVCNRAEWLSRRKKHVKKSLSFSKLVSAHLKILRTWCDVLDRMGVSFHGKQRQCGIV